MNWRRGSSLVPMTAYTAAAGTPTADALKLLASWAASQDDLPTETAATSAG
jgi:hypothetical protein